MAQRAILVLAKTPDQATAEEIAQRVAREYSDDTQTSLIWVLDTIVPDWLTESNVALADQLSAYRRDAGEDACFMTVMMCTDEEADEIYDEK
jgi:hypothetical protein